MERKMYMSDAQKAKMGIQPRTHEACLRLVGVKRPGKTAKDKARKENK